MDFALARNWWVVAVRGLLAILFGLVAFFWPGFVWLVIVFTFAIYAIVDGVMALIAAFGPEWRSTLWWPLVVEALVGIGAGVLASVWPAITELALLYVIALWALATGVFQVIAAMRLRQFVPNEWLLGIRGALSIVLGLGLAFMPLAGLVAVAWWIGACSIAFGGLFLRLAVRLRQFSHDSEHAHDQHHYDPSNLPRPTL
jgi:uncharacterized membrane protein HdeD (DUF308 family)